MGEITNNFLSATNKPKDIQKKLRRSRKPKFEVGKPKKRIDNKKKDKKRKRKLREEFDLMVSEMSAINQRLDEFGLILAKRREMNRNLKELDVMNNALLEFLATL